MPKTDVGEAARLEACDTGALKSVATRSELSKFKAAARVTAIKDRCVNIRLSSGDLQDIQVKALEEGLPYQTLFASVLHHYVAAWPAERESQPAPGFPQPKSWVQRASKMDI